MPSFIEVFGGNVVNPAQLSYVSYEISDDLVLQWPFLVDETGNPIAAKTDVDADSGGLSVFLPDATQVSIGTDVLIRNTGSATFSVKSSDGTTIVAPTSGTAWYVSLTDNSTTGGTWYAVQFGAGTSSANASSLAGNGLLAIVTKLNQNLVVVDVPGDYTPSSNDRAKVLLGGGGVVTYDPPAASTLGNGWFVYVINGGSGTLTWAPTSGTIDGQATKVFQPTENAVIFSDGTDYWSLGYGRSIVSTVTGTSINLAGQSGTFVLSGTQVAAQVQDYSGALAGDTTVQYGSSVGYWFVKNGTTAHTLTFQATGADPGVTVASGTFSVLRSNGSSMSVAFSATAGTVTQVNTAAGRLTGGPITTTGTIDLANSGVAAGVYGGGLNYPVVTVDQYGRVTAASTVTLGSAAALTAGGSAGNVPVLDSNGLVPSVNGGASTGDVKATILRVTAPTGWLWLNGTTIGDASSGGTQLASATASQLFTALWNNVSDSQAPVSGGRGANAAADFAAHKTITLPDLRGRVVAGLDNMGGAASANRLNTAMSSTSNCATGGSQSQTTTVPVTVTGVTGGSLSVSVSGTTAGSVSVAPVTGGGGAAAANNHTHTFTGTGTTSGTLNVLASGTGTSASFVIVQPTMVMSWVIKL